MDTHLISFTSVSAFRELILLLLVMEHSSPLVHHDCSNRLSPASYWNQGTWSNSSRNRRCSLFHNRLRAYSGTLTATWVLERCPTIITRTYTIIFRKFMVCCRRYCNLFFIGHCFSFAKSILTFHQSLFWLHINILQVRNALLGILHRHWSRRCYLRSRSS